MRNTLTIILSFAFLNSFGQCSLNNLFPVEFFETKFDTELKLRKSGIFEIYSLQNAGSWHKPNYLDGDSVYITSLRASISTNCIYKNELEVRFLFADDKLYGVFFEVIYKTNESDKCIEDYNRIASDVIKTYPIFSEVNVKDTETQQKIGEAYKFYRSKDEQLRNKYSTARLQFSKARDNYILEFGYKNFDEVKVTHLGFPTE